MTKLLKKLPVELNQKINILLCDKYKKIFDKSIKYINDITSTKKFVELEFKDKYKHILGSGEYIIIRCPRGYNDNGTYEYCRLVSLRPKIDYGFNSILLRTHKVLLYVKISRFQFKYYNELKRIINYYNDIERVFLNNYMSSDDSDLEHSDLEHSDLEHSDLEHSE